MAVEGILEIGATAPLTAAMRATISLLAKYTPKPYHITGARGGWPKFSVGVATVRASMRSALIYALSHPSA